MENVQKTMRDSAALRWTMLVFLSALIFGTYWFQYFYGGLKGLMESELGFSSEQFGRIIGLTTIANMFGMIIHIFYSWVNKKNAVNTEEY